MPHRRAVAALALAAALAGACREGQMDPEGAREAREAMLFTIASRFREPSAALGVLAFEHVVWSDACLEIERRGACPEGPVEGYRLRLTRRGEAYEYRATAQDPSDVALASGPDPRIGTPALSWSWEAAPGGCRTLLVSADGQPVVGWCDGPAVGLAWLEGRFSDAEWSYLYQRFTGVEQSDGEHTLSFTGTGSEEPTPAWRDAVMRWAALRWSELQAGRSGAAHGRALAYRRPVRDRAGYCDVLEVTEYGVAYLARSQCEGGGGEPGRAVWLSDELWDRLNGWLKEWAPHTDQASGMHFFGRGTRAPGAADLRELAAWTDLAMAYVASTDPEAWPSR